MISWLVEISNVSQNYFKIGIKILKSAYIFLKQTLKMLIKKLKN